MGVNVGFEWLRKCNCVNVGFGWLRKCLGVDVGLTGLTAVGCVPSYVRVDSENLPYVAVYNTWISILWLVMMRQCQHFVDVIMVGMLGTASMIFMIIFCTMLVFILRMHIPMRGYAGGASTSPCWLQYRT